MEQNEEKVKNTEHTDKVNEETIKRNAQTM